MREKYESLSLAVLRDLAKARDLKGFSTMKKQEIIELMLAEDEKDRAKVTTNITGKTNNSIASNIKNDNIDSSRDINNSTNDNIHNDTNNVNDSENSICVCNDKQKDEMAEDNPQVS